MKNNVLLVLAVVIVFLCLVTYFLRSTSQPPTQSQPSTPPSTVDPNLEKRKRFARGLEVSTHDNAETIHNVRYTTEGSSASTLVITADGIVASDCLNLAKSTYGQAGASIGFITLTCRNRISGGELSLGLSQ